LDKGLSDFLDAFKTAVLKKSVIEDRIDKQKVILKRLENGKICSKK